MNKLEKKAWKIMTKAAELNINMKILNENGEEKNFLNITSNDVISWAAQLEHPELNALLKELGIPIWEKTPKGDAVVEIEAYLHSDREDTDEMLEKLGKSEDAKFRQTFGDPLYEVKFTLAVQSDGRSKIVKVDDRIVYEE